MTSSKYCFLTCIQISQEAGQVVWYSPLFQNFPQFIVIHTVKGFDIVNKAERDVFLELSCFFHDPADHTLPYIKQIASRNLLYDARTPKLVFCDKLEMWDEQGNGREV